MPIAMWIRPLFLIAAAYDGVLGVAFLVALGPIYQALNIPPPNHAGYVQFPAALLIVFAIGFLMIARDPVRYRDFIILGILLKISYCSVVFGHWFLSSIPGIWVVFAWCDLAFLAAFVAAFRSLEPVPAPGSL